MFSLGPIKNLARLCDFERTRRFLFLHKGSGKNRHFFETTIETYIGVRCVHRIPAGSLPDAPAGSRNVVGTICNVAGRFWGASAGKCGAAFSGRGSPGRAHEHFKRTRSLQ